jgi:hypothetical protein
MVHVFQQYWWLLFPFFWFISAGWHSMMRYKRTQAKIDLLKTYAMSGKEPPADLIASLDKPDDGRHDWSDDDDHGSRGRGRGGPFLVVLFAGLAGVFAYTGYSGWLGQVDTEFYFVAMILGVLSLAFLVASIFKSGRKED